MARPGDRSYRFDAAGHWAAGAVSGFAADAGGLVVEPRLAPRRIAGSEAGTIAAVDPCGRPMWLRPGSGEVFVLHEFGAELQGRIGAGDARAIHPGPSLLWVRSGERVQRHAARTLQELGALEVPDLAASAADGCDGLWLLTHGETGALVRWLDPHGCVRGPAIRLRDARNPIAIAADPARRRLAILDVPHEADGAAPQWALHIVDLARCRARKPLRFTPDPKDPRPAWIAADGKGGFRLASAGAKMLLIGVSAEGVESARQFLDLHPSTAVEGLLWHDGPILDCDDGLYRLVAAGEDDQEESKAGGTLITPTLISPPGTPSGWNRAEIHVDLPPGATLAATIFASAAESLARDVRQALADTAEDPADRGRALTALLAGDRARLVRTQSYKGEGDQVLHLLLDRIAEPYLWLKLEISCPPGAGPARLLSLRVRYPDRSWLDDLPAIYRDEPAAAAQLRQFLAPFEALYGGIDEAIDRLPARIHPDTADEDRLGWLLGWLGFPPTAGLTAKVQRDLLKAAGGLLERRGTLGALVAMLEIVTGARPSVDDGGGSLGLWIVGDGLGRLSPRLGRDTRIVSRRPLGFRPGSGMRLGEEPLPPFCTGLDRILRANCARVAIGIAVEPARRDVVGPIIDSLLAMFVPAHCAIDLKVARAGRTPPGGRLDQGWRLADANGGTGGERVADPDATELGCETEAGAWRLPGPGVPPFTINAEAALDGVRRLG